jgi:hypothetical protein
MWRTALTLPILAAALQAPNAEDTTREFRERYGEPDEAVLLKEDNGTLFIDAKPRFQDQDLHGVILHNPPESTLLRLKVRGKECTDWWEHGNRTKAELDHRKLYRFAISSHADETGICDVRRVWLGEALVFDIIKTKPTIKRERK